MLQQIHNTIKCSDTISIIWPTSLQHPIEWSYCIHHNAIYRRQLLCGMQQFLFNILAPRCSIRADACKNIFYGDLNLLGSFDLQKSPQEPKKHNFLNGTIIVFIMYQPSRLHIEEWSFKRIHQELNKKMQFENLWRRSHVNILIK